MKYSKYSTINTVNHYYYRNPILIKKRYYTCKQLISKNY